MKPEKGSNGEPKEPAEKVIKKVVVPPKVAAATVSKATDTGWVSVVGKYLARAMVEKGLTPFEKGVAPLLEDVAERLRIAGKEYKNRHSEIYAKFKDIPRNDMVQRDLIHAELKELSRTWENDREAIVQEFRTALGGLTGEER